MSLLDTMVQYNNLCCLKRTYLGNFILRNDSLQCIITPAGYVYADGNYFHYIADYQADTPTRNISYDGLGRISLVAAEEDDRFNEEYYYDLNGNTEVIVRGSETPYDATFLIYEGNQLKYTYDEIDFDEYWGEIPQFAASSYDSLEYDLNGRVIKDTGRFISSIAYHPNGMPSIIRMDPGGNQIFNYRSDGQKIRDQLRSRYIKTVKEVNADGDTVYVQRDAWSVTTRAYYGRFMSQGNKYRYYHEGGYVDFLYSVASPRYYEKDYLGSVRSVRDTDGNIEQATDYLVTGIPVTRGSGASVDDRLHTGKPFYGVNGLALYDNNARFYSPIDGRFTSIDPLGEKYPDISPYVHCNNNPLSIIDPTGMDIWELNNKGEIISRIEDKTEDAFYMVALNADGEYERTDNYLSFKYGTIERQSTFNTEGDKSYDVYQVRGDDNGTQLFEFMSENISGSNSKVEISHAKVGKEGEGKAKGKIEKNYITTGHIKGSEPGMTHLIDGQLLYGYTLRELNHSHPKDTKASKNDNNFKNSVIENLNYNKLPIPVFNIYHVPTNEYIPF